MQILEENRESPTLFGASLIETTLVPVDLAQAFEAMVKPVMERILENLNEFRALTALRDALLPRLVSGKLRVMLEKE